MVPESPTGLYWSIRGEVSCRDHACIIGDERFGRERWRPIPLTAVGRHGLRYQCQYCAPEGTPVVHRRLTPMVRLRSA